MRKFVFCMQARRSQAAAHAASNSLAHALINTVFFLKKIQYVRSVPCAPAEIREDSGGQGS